jgi:hypothetical protein
VSAISVRGSQPARHADDPVPLLLPRHIPQCMQRRLLPRGRSYPGHKRGFIRDNLARPRIRSSPIEIPLGNLDQRRVRLRAAWTLDLRAEAVQRCQRAALVAVKSRPDVCARQAAPDGGPVKLAVGGLEQRCGRLRATGAIEALQRFEGSSCMRQDSNSTRESPIGVAARRINGVIFCTPSVRSLGNREQLLRITLRRPRGSDGSHRKAGQHGWRLMRDSRSAT